MAKSMKTPLGRVRGLGAARSGTDHFWLIRTTAVANVPLTAAFVLIVLLSVFRPYDEAVALFANPLVSVFAILIVAVNAVHMRLGMQTIIEDYVHHEGTKVMALMANTFFTILVAVTAIYCVLKIGFGA